MLRIHARRLAGGDAEEVRIELIDLFEESAPSAVDLAGGTRAGIVEGVNVEPIRRNLLDGVAALGQQTPERFRPGGLGEAAADTSDGDRSMHHCVVPPGFSSAPGGPDLRSTSHTRPLRVRWPRRPPLPPVCREHTEVAT